MGSIKQSIMDGLMDNFLILHLYKSFKSPLRNLLRATKKFFPNTLITFQSKYHLRSRDIPGRLYFPPSEAGYMQMGCLYAGLHFWFASPGESKITSGEFHFRIFTGGEFDLKVFRLRKLQKEPGIINCYKYFGSSNGHIPYSTEIIQIGILHICPPMLGKFCKKGTLRLLENGFAAI